VSIDIKQGLMFPVRKSGNPNIKKGALNTKNAKELKLKKACREFESLFLANLMRTMRKSFSEDGILSGKGFGQSTFMDLMDGEVARFLTESNQKGLGISSMLYKQLSSILEMEGGGMSNSDKISGFNSYNRGLRPEIQYNADIKSYDKYIRDSAAKYGVDPALIYAVIERESSGNPMASSGKGAKGLMQLVDATAKDMGVRDVYNPKENIEGGTKYLRMMLDRFEGNVPLALAAYNSGPGNVEKYGGLPPFRETEEYVSRVMESFNNYKLTLAQNQIKTSDV